MPALPECCFCYVVALDHGRAVEAGVEIYEFLPTMLHQKTMIVDATWATVGTANFDNRSFALNEETNLCFHDRTVVDELRAIYTADLERCQRLCETLHQRCAGLRHAV